MIAVIRKNPALAYAAPFAVYLLFMLPAATGMAVGEAAAQPAGIDWRWIYAVQVSCVALVLAACWREYAELAQRETLRFTDIAISAACGAAVYALWIHLDWATLGVSPGYAPTHADGSIHWPLAVLRLAGAVLVVPLMEELFWRSFVMRWLQAPDFLQVDPAHVGMRAFIITALLFGVEHHLWLAGICAGVVYGALYLLRRNLWLPIIAHAVTNALLGGWVLVTRQWQFW